MPHDPFESPDSWGSADDLLQSFESLGPDDGEQLAEVTRQLACGLAYHLLHDNPPADDILRRFGRAAALRLAGQPHGTVDMEHEAIQPTEPNKAFGWHRKKPAAPKLDSIERMQQAGTLAAFVEKLRRQGVDKPTAKADAAHHYGISLRTVEERLRDADIEGFISDATPLDELEEWISRT